MQIIDELREEVKELLKKKIKAKKTGISTMKAEAYEYFKEKAPWWIKLIFGLKFKKDITNLFMEAMNELKHSKTTNI